MSSKLAILQRQFARQNTERIPVAPASDDLAAAIERLVQERVDQALEEVKPPAHVQRIRDQFDAPKPYTDYRQPAPAPKTPKVFESVVSQRDALGRIAKMISKSTSGAGPTIETVVAQRDELGRIVRLVNTQIDDTALPDPPRM